jgi:hypothetical protein
MSLSRAKPIQSIPPHLIFPRSNYPPTTDLVFLMVSLTLALPPIIYMCCFFAPFVLHIRPFNPPWLDQFNHTWRRVQTTKLPTVQLYEPSRHFISLRSKYSPQQHVLKHSQSMFLPQYQNPSFTTMQNHRQHYSFIYSNIYVFRQQMRRWKVLDQMVTHITGIQSPLDFLLNQTEICYYHSKTLKLWQIFKQSTIHMSWFWPAFRRQDSNIYLVFSIFISRPTSLLATIKVFVFFFIVSMLSRSNSHNKHRQQLICPIQFQPTCFSWTFLVAYFKKSLKAMAIKHPLVGVEWHLLWSSD